MKVLFVTNMYPEVDGSYFGIFVHELRVSLQRLGVTVDVQFTDGRRSTASYLSALPRLRRALGVEYDVVHAHHTYSVVQTVLVRPGSANRRTPLLLSFHEGETFAPRGLPHERRRALRSVGGSLGFKRWSARRADGLVAVEERLRAALGFDGPAWVVPPGVDTEFFSPRDRSESRNMLGIDEDATVAFFPARPTHAKGFDVFEDALRRLDVQPLVGGDIPRAQMPTYFSASDVIVAPSRFEASPMVVKEAMAMARPVVSTDVGDVRELFAGVAGCELCEANGQSLADAVQRALAVDEAAGRARLFERGLTVEAVARRHLDVYGTLVG